MRICFIILAMSFSIVLSAQNHWDTWYEKSNFLETPRYSQTIEYAHMLADSSSMITYKSFGMSPRGRDLPLLILDRDGLSDPDSIRKKNRVIILIEACIHPGESEGKDAGLMLFRDIGIFKKNINLLDNVSIIFIPIFNVDGHERFSPYNRINQNGPKEMGWRCTASNLNLNRDFVKADAPEMKQWLIFYNKWLPELFMDIHTTDGADYQYVITYGIEAYGNMDNGLTEWLKDGFMPFVEEKMDTSGFPMFPYVAFRRWHDPRSGLRSGPSSPRYSQSYTATRNRPGILVETHMLKPYKQRVEATYKFILQSMEYLNTNYKGLISRIAEADRLCISGDLRDEPFPLKYRALPDSVMVSFKGVKYSVQESDLTGGPWFTYTDTPQTFILPWFNMHEVSQQVMLPKAYIIPPEWFQVTDILALHGVEMDTLQNATIYDISSYRFSDVSWRNKPYEGRMMIDNITVTPVNQKRLFPAGSIIIPVNQQAARLIAYALEPYSADAFLQWGFFNSIFEQKEYAESYVIEKIAHEMIEEDPELRAEFEAFKQTLTEGRWRIWMMYNWFYSRTPYFDTNKDLYPVGKIEK